MDIIASDALKNTKWGHKVKTKTKGLLSITYTQNEVKDKIQQFHL